MRYFVVAEDGNKYGPADLETLNTWIAEGRLAGTTILEEEASGARVAASAVSGLNFPTAAPGPSSPYATPPAGSAQVQSPTGSPGYAYQTAVDAGKTELIISWIMGGLGLVCCGGVGWILAAIGIATSVAGKNKGNPNAQAAMIFNIVVLVISLVTTALLVPVFMKSYQAAQAQQTRQLMPPRPAMPGTSTSTP